MFTTLKHFFEGLLHLAFEQKKEPVYVGDKELPKCCQDATKKALNNQEHQDIIKNTFCDKYIYIKVQCSVCYSILGVQVKGKKTISYE